MHGNWPRGGTAGGGCEIEKAAEGGGFQGRSPGVMSASDGQRDRNKYYFASITPPPRFGTAIYGGVARKGRGGGTERSSGIN